MLRGFGFLQSRVGSGLDSPAKDTQCTQSSPIEAKVTFFLFVVTAKDFLD